MAKISYREKILLGYNPNSLSNSSSRRNSEVDFSDVFGGPPRCSSSTQEYYNNDIDSDIGDDAVDDDDDGSWYFGLRERPVFGDQFGVQRRHYGSDDFYDDIFGGDQLLLSCSLSPRVHMSPSRPSSATAEPSTSPSKFSLAGRVANTDTMNNTSKNQSLTKFLGRSLSRFNQTVQNRLTFNGDDARTSYQPSSLPRQIAVGEKQLTNNSKKTGATDQHEPKFIMEESKGSKFAKDNMQFHFSIYKWANNGVPIAMPSRKRSPSRPKEKVASDANMIKKNSRGDENVNVGILSSKRRMPFAAQAEREHERNNGMIVGEMRVEYKPEVGKAEKKPTNEADEAHSDEKDVDAKMKKHSQKMKKLNSKPLRTLLGQDKEGNKKATPEKERKQSKANETVKQPSLKDETFPSYKVSRKSKVRESFTGKTDDFRKGDVSGTVKGFVKIFNQGSSHENSYVNTFPTKNHDEMQDSYVDLGKGSFEYIEVVDGESFLSGEQECNINNGSGSVSNSATNDGPSIDGSRASAPQTSAPYVDDNLGKIVAQDIDSPLAIVAEETQDYERKVRQWSKGKEGNIRALLSTMQNILWPNSGWKPIPLVDIIEANGVKKAYQRALLCLHPDKLQQKGAAPHHKFIAEKVFDILQEAWDEFNSIGML